MSESNSNSGCSFPIVGIIAFVVSCYNMPEAASTGSSLLFAVGVGILSDIGARIGGRIGIALGLKITSEDSVISPTFCSLAGFTLGGFTAYTIAQPLAERLAIG